MSTPEPARSLEDRLAVAERELRILRRRFKYFAITMTCVIALVIVPGLQTALGLLLFGVVVIFGVLVYMQGLTPVLDAVTGWWQTRSSRQRGEGQASDAGSDRPTTGEVKEV
ncbi:MAG: hypothetical protein R3B90_18625 [Planctomycetaceae bacterium]